ncbi:iron transporter [Streptomyces pluripotens]|uniref:Iron transporter n=1 Tax=Streptomyces pluripotens TaxID=1355015 RepID=A0A221P955_9ACTN|nr:MULTISPECIES: IucA/IucC family protein [Streptomyces]ARP74474.1 iron transporter [Streptomyces pluripotens]ASN28750.1 iron transporter [Streptomyces pluripotens]KIE28834.1 iron transporter [Streptomyces sp. MUSC 125]MCH0557989.1 IucA/IucC family siderophore biosynthesis protein [Streptomyces sp. MUM 16J]
MYRPLTTEAEVARELAGIRPGLLPGYTAELPGARAAVLTRLWRALAHEPLPWVTRRFGGTGGLALLLDDGRALHGPASDPYATGAHVNDLRLDGVPYDDPALLVADLAVPHAAGFSAELAHSVVSLALSRADAVHPEEWPAQDWQWEQRVIDGHPFHPNCRARTDFSVSDQLAYGPEHRPVVELGTVPVRADQCLVSGSWPGELRDGGHLLLPVHPWQAEHVLKRSSRPWRTARPLLSLRTLAPTDGGPHVKTALSTRLTSSVRDISGYSVRASADLSALGAALAARTDGLLHVTHTLGAVSAHSPDLAALLRESPEVYAAPGERVLPVAALTTTALPSSPAWLAAFTRLALTVGLRLLELGVALEAHGQNLLVILSAGGEPVRLVYRDLADIRISPARLAHHGLTPPDLTGRLITDDETALRRKLFGSLVAGALAGTAGSGPALGAALESAVPDLPDTADLRALREDPLPAKALTLMRLSPDSPGDLWTSLPNPLVLERGPSGQ